MAETNGEVYAKHAELLQKIQLLFSKKNSDYGNAFFEMNSSKDLYPPFMDIQRKFLRLKCIVEKQKNDEQIQVVDETLTDTMLDLANYSVMLAVLIELDKGGKK